MLYVCLPTYNEAVTVGVLLWRLRTVLREQAEGRDYEVVVYDDASTDATRDVLAPYARVLPLTVIAGARRIGQSGAVDTLLRHVAARAQTPASDAVVLLQADYTDPPEHLPELLRAFDAGADVVLTRRPAVPEQSVGERRLRRLAPLLPAPLLRPAIADPAARDPAALVGFLRLLRVSVVRDALRSTGSAPLPAAPGWAGTVELAIRTAPFAARTERLDMPARYDVRTRASRIEWRRELRGLGAVLWANRGAARRSAAAIGTTPATVPGPTLVGDGSRAAPLPPDATADHDVPDASGGAPDDAESTAARRGRRRRRGRSRSETAAPTQEVASREAPSSEPPSREPPSGELLPHEPKSQEPPPPESPPRKREPRTRRSRRPNDATPEPTDAVAAPEAPPDQLRDTPPEARSVTPDTTADEPPTAAAEGPADATSATSARRRRRRGGARRGGRGPDADSGVSPENADLGPDGDPAIWRATPSDQPTP